MYKIHVLCTCTCGIFLYTKIHIITVVMSMSFLHTKNDVGEDLMGLMRYLRPVVGFKGPLRGRTGMEGRGKKD